MTVGKVGWDPRIYERQIEEKKRKEEEEERKKKEAAKRAMNLLTNKTSKTSTQVILIPVLLTGKKRFISR